MSHSSQDSRGQAVHTDRLVDLVRKLITDHRAICKSPSTPHSIVVGVFPASRIFREVILTGKRVGLIPGVTMSSDPDELCCVDGVPIRLRVSALSDQVLIVKPWDLPAATCCDRTAMSSMIAASSEGRA